MKTIAIVGVVIAALLVLPLDVSAQTKPADKIDLKVLYAGQPGSAREKDFVDFLGRHFREVKTSDLAQFHPGAASGFDVILMDYDGDPFKAPCPNLLGDYTRPTVTVAVPGAMICRQLGLKTGYQ
jgi:hypothetical protein